MFAGDATSSLYALVSNNVNAFISISRVSIYMYIMHIFMLFSYIQASIKMKLHMAQLELQKGKDLNERLKAENEILKQKIALKLVK